MGVADVAFDDLHLSLVRALAQPAVIDLYVEPDLGDRLAVEDLLPGQFVAPVFRAEHLVDAVKDVRMQVRQERKELSVLHEKGNVKSFNFSYIMLISAATYLTLTVQD
ncbi:MAG: hypothetical protein V2I32_09795 [Desulforhopalus sp.]|nr:hypothetical protein [Desulforhopalus sp.]